MTTKGRSFKKAVEDKCKDCIYDPVGVGTWRQQTQNCPSTDCPLYDYRPLSFEGRKKKKEVEN